MPRFICISCGRRWDARKSIPPERERDVHRVIAAEAERCGCSVLAIGGTTNHVHVLLRFGRTTSMARVTNQMKGVASYLLNGPRPPGAEPTFRWQPGYGVVSVEPAHLDSVCRYIGDQKRRHAQGDDALWPRLEYLPDEFTPYLPPRNDSGEGRRPFVAEGP